MLARDFNHSACAFECGALLGAGGSFALAGWFRNSWSIKKLLSVSAAAVLTAGMVGVFSGELVDHSTMMTFVKPFAHCGSVGMVGFGAVAIGFKLLVDESIYGNHRVLSASLATGMVAAYITSQVMNGNISL